jgi:hypothetical protein
MLLFWIAINSEVANHIVAVPNPLFSVRVRFFKSQIWLPGKRISNFLNTQREKHPFLERFSSALLTFFLSDTHNVRPLRFLENFALPLLMRRFVWQ